MTALITRITLRYLAGGLVAAGWLAPDLGAQLSADPEVLAVIGVLIGLSAEVSYACAKKWGWAT